jgi:hypothetical protein
MITVPTPDPNILVFDDVLADADGYREMALGLPYQSYTLGLATFYGIAMAPPVVSDLIARECPERAPTLSFFRQSPEGQAEPNFIHSDRSMGAWTGLLYLTPNPPEEDGTTFWEHASGERFDASPTIDEYATNGLRWIDTDQWTPWYRVQAKFNRLVLFAAPYYHSRAIFENFGEGASARLVNVTFGSWKCQ